MTEDERRRSGEPGKARRIPATASPATGAEPGAIGSTGVTGMGSSAIGHPAGATGGAAPQDASGRDVPIRDEDRAQGVTEQREVSVSGTAAAAREATVLNQGVGPTGALGSGGSGSTSDVPGGVPVYEDDQGIVGGTLGTGIGGPTPTGSDIAQAGVSGAGRRDEKTQQGEKDTPTQEGRRMAEHDRNRP